MVRVSLRRGLARKRLIGLPAGKGERWLKIEGPGMNALKHIGIVLFGLFLCLVLPGLFFVDVDALLSGGFDAVSGASMELPDQPSGEFVVIINREKHPLTLDKWSAFFLEEPVGVILEDISCLAASSDPAGTQLARRYLARLAENQMKLHTENSLLVVSRAENGLYDVIVLSREMADAVDFSAVYARDDALVLVIAGVTE